MDPSANTGHAARAQPKDRGTLLAALRERLLPIARHDMPEHAEDLVQTALMRLLRELDKPRKEGFASLERYAYTVYRHTLADALRKEIPHRQWVPLEPAIGIPDSEHRRPDRQVERRERRRILWQSVQRLEPKYRRALLLRYAECKSYEEIARILRLPIGTVGSRLSEARSRLVRTAARLARIKLD